MIKFILAFFLLVPLAHSFSAKVIFSKGKVTKLLPGTRVSEKVRRGDRLPEDTSVVTGEKSLVKLQFPDKSTLVLAPKGKFVISRLKRKKRGVISLLTGEMRLKVTKSVKKKVKFFVKTRSAAMGVRGTSFVSVYNDKNKVTSLVTLEGEVAIKKIPKTAQRSKNVAVSENKILEEVASKKVTVVKAGRFSSVTQGIKKESIPVKLAPAQVKAIGKSMGVTVKDVKADDPPAEGLENLDKGDYAPKSGGYLDLVTGLYVKPGKDSTYDEEKNIYVPSKKEGSIDEKTGRYVPPKGLELDAVKGFVVKKDVDVQEKARLNAFVSDLNEEYVKTQGVESETGRSLYEKYILNLSYQAYRDGLEISRSGGDENVEASAEPGFIFTVAVGKRLNENWEGVLYGGINNQSFYNVRKGVNGEGSENLGRIGVLGKYILTGRTHLLAGLGSHQQYAFQSPTGSPQGNDLNLIKLWRDKLYLGAFHAFTFRGKVKNYLELGLTMLKSMSKQGIHMRGSGEWTVKGGHRREIENDLFLDISLWAVKGMEKTGELDISKTSIGTTINYDYHF